VTLKRYCTEFEIKLGPSNEYQWQDGIEDIEKAIFAAVDLESIGRPALQPTWLVGHIVRKWIEHAWDRADPTAIMFNDNQPLYTPSVTYHPEPKVIEEG